MALWRCAFREAERQNGRMAEKQNGRMAERQNGRMAERQNGRTAERQKGREAERQNGRMRVGRDHHILAIEKLEHHFVTNLDSPQFLLEATLVGGG